DAEPVDAGVLWEAQAGVVDVLHKARQRQVCGVLLDDACYQLCARHAVLHPHHASALLVQQLVVPRNIRGQENPLHAAMAKLHEPGRRAINQCTAT
ncbi:hypothetical protein, partial [Pseudomonas syringae]|uniref:hypothetical protein n=1 Tax=Pseudomonas syringae TaxID=317 RepID=UPI00051598BD